MDINSNGIMAIEPKEWAQYGYYHGKPLGELPLRAISEQITTDPNDLYPSVDQAFLPRLWNAVQRKRVERNQRISTAVLADAIEYMIAVMPAEEA
jgi:hypothetical protein